MNLCPRRSSTRCVSAPRAAWCLGSALVLAIVCAGCQSKTTKEKSPGKTAEPKTRPAKTATPKESKAPVVKKTEPKKKTTPEVAKKEPPKKKETPKKKDPELTPEQKAVAAAIVALTEIGAVLDTNNLDEVVKVTFTEKEAVKDEHFAHLKHFPYLRYIDATRTGIGDAAIKHLEGAEFITELYLFGTNVGNDSLKTIGNMRRMEKLCLDRTKISDEGLKHLQNLPVISKLHIRSRNKISDAGLSPIYKLKSLRELKIGGTQITASGKKKLETLLPRCTVDTEPAPK